MEKITQSCSSYAIALLFVFCFLSFESKAAFSNYNSILIGDLAAGMGGAAAAVPGDTSAAPYYNPATLAEVRGETFSASVGIYKKFDTTYGQDEDFTKAPLRVNQGFFRSVPSSTGQVMRLGDSIFAFTIVVPDYDEFKGDLKKLDQNATTLSMRDESLWVGGTLARKISETESMGLSLYYTARNLDRSLNDRTYTSSTQATLYTEEKTLKQNALVAILGYYKELNDQWSYGASFRTPAMKVSGKAVLYRSLTQVNTTTSSLLNTIENYPDENARVVIPGMIRVGAAYKPDNAWTWALDLTAHEGIGYKDIENSAIAMTSVHHAMVNINLGVETIWKDWLKSRVGVYSNLSSHDDPDPTLLQVQEDKVDMLGFSANVVLVSKGKMDFTFGGYYTGGRGRSMQRIQQNYSVVVKNQHIFTMLVGSSYYF